MDRSNKIVYKCITANIGAIWQHAAHATDQLTSPSCQTGATQNTYFFTKNIEEFSGENKSGEWAQAEKKDRTIVRLN